MIHLKLKQQLADFTLDLDLTLPARGVSAIVGPSGSGKTTLLRCVAGLEKADQALIEINGNCWQDSQHGLWLPPHKRALGYVFQEASLFDHLSVHGNLDYGRRRSAEPASDKQAAQIIKLLGIGHLLQRSTTGLSGGEREGGGDEDVLSAHDRHDDLQGRRGGGGRLGVCCACCGQHPDQTQTHPTHSSFPHALALPDNGATLS